jgi:hypothetical protein
MICYDDSNGELVCHRKVITHSSEQLFEVSVAKHIKFADIRCVLLSSVVGLDSTQPSYSSLNSKGSTQPEKKQSSISKSKKVLHEGSTKPISYDIYMVPEIKDNENSSKVSKERFHEYSYYPENEPNSNPLNITAEDQFQPLKHLLDDNFGHLNNHLDHLVKSDKPKCQRDNNNNNSNKGNNTGLSISNELLLARRKAAELQLASIPIKRIRTLNNKATPENASQNNFVSSDKYLETSCFPNEKPLKSFKNDSKMIIDDHSKHTKLNFDEHSDHSPVISLQKEFMAESPSSSFFDNSSGFLSERTLFEKVEETSWFKTEYSRGHYEKKLHYGVPPTIFEERRNIHTTESSDGIKYSITSSNSLYHNDLNSLTPTSQLRHTLTDNENFMTFDEAGFL